MNKKKLLVHATVFTAMLGMVAPAAIIQSGGSPVYAEDHLTSNNPIADETSERSISLYKYAIKDSSELGENGDGEETTISGKDPLAGITFTVEYVKPIGNASLTDPTKDVEGTDYSVVKTVGDFTTDANGYVKIPLGVGTSVDGYYRLTEKPDPRVAKTTPPFFVLVPQTDRKNQDSLIYDVVVQPKNIVDSPLEPSKTADDGSGYSIKAGQTFTWEATSNVPAGLYQVAAQDMTISPVYDASGNLIADMNVSAGDEIYANYFKITDKLAAELLLDDVKMQTSPDGGVTWNDLVFGTDYEITVDGATASQPVTSTSTSEKEVVASLTEAGMKKVSQSGDDKIRVVYTTHVDKDFNGVISNHMDVDFLTPGLKPVTTPNPEDPEYFTGGFDINKIGSDLIAPDNKLEGAVFRLSETEADAKAERYIASDGKTYHKDDTLPAGVTFLESTSDSNGHAGFNGLPLEWFTDLDGDGKQDPSTEPTWPHADIKKVYWVSEVQAPSGYELLKEPKEVEVTLSSANTIGLEVEDNPKTTLPFTGGQGTALLVTIALGAITVGTVAFTLDKKKRHA